MKRQGIFLRTVKSRNRGRASERAVCGVFSDFSLAEPASHPAYAPTTKSPARYSAGRAKQHNHARNVKPLSLLGGVRGGQCPLPCPAQEACVAGGSAPGRGHTHQRPLVVGLCPPPCLVREVCIAGDSAPGRGHTYQRPFVIRQCPLPLPANLSVLLTLPCPGALPLLFHPTPGRTCP